MAGLDWLRLEAVTRKHSCDRDRCLRLNPAGQSTTPTVCSRCIGIISAANIERVKGLLRSYEDGELMQAAQQKRRAISYQFLWDALGLQR